MNTPFRRIVAAAVLALLVFGASALPGRAQRASGQFQSREHGIAFTAPRGWANMGDKTPEGAVCAFTSSRTDEITTNMNLTVSPTPPGASRTAPLPTSTAKELVKMLRGTFPDYRVVSTSRMRVAGVDALVITNAYSHPQASGTVKNRQIVLVRNGKVYTFTLTASARAFTAAAPVFDRAVKTLRWLR